MDLHEYQAKQLLRTYGIESPPGQVASSVEAATTSLQTLQPMYVIKPQILVNGQRRRVVSRMVANTDDALQAVRTTLNSRLYGQQVYDVLIETVMPRLMELALQIRLDRESRRPVLYGLDIDTNRQYAVPINPLIGLLRYQAIRLCSRLNLPQNQWEALIAVALGMYQCFVEKDATLVALDSLVALDDGRLIALDARITIDDMALHRQHDLETMRDTRAETITETVARETGVVYVKLKGQIGCMANGAGLAMATADMINHYGQAFGISAASFLDLGGNTRSTRVEAALRVLLTDPKVEAIVVSVFGAMTRCDEVAHGVVSAVREIEPTIPLVVRLQGRNFEIGKQIIQTSKLDNLFTAGTLSEGARRAVRLVQDKHHVNHP